MNKTMRITKASSFITPNIDKYKTSKSIFSQERKSLSSSKTIENTSVIRLTSSQNNKSILFKCNKPILFLTQSRNNKANSQLDRTDLNQDSTEKYSFIPNIKLLKHLSSHMIDSMLTLDHNSESERVPHHTEQRVFFSNKKAKSKATMASSQSVESSSIHLPLKRNDSDPYSLDQMITLKSNKLIMANVNQTKHIAIFKSRNREQNPLGKAKTNHPAMRVGSMMDRFLLKLFHPDDCIEDYVASNYQGDKYKRFKMLLKNEKERISKIFADNKQSQQINVQVLKLYTAKLRKKGQVK